jgi:uncharacterized protein (DUF362 family)/NAD-dependent dihydropyrimidine dehydrogenase PreA subunit
MNTRVSVRKCTEYDVHEVYSLISDIYKTTGGPDVGGKKVLVKPNILSENDPARCVSTHPVVVEAMIRYLQAKGATVFVGDSPAVHTGRFRGDKCGIYQVCETTGATWANFLDKPVEKKVNGRNIRIASITDNVDLIISLPKFKNHELMYFTGAIKNTYGLIPGFTKGLQHGVYRDRNSFGEFLIDLGEVITPDYYLMDAIMGMEGQGPGPKGIPVNIGLIIGSTNPLALDIIACQVAGYKPTLIPTNKTALERKKWLNSEAEIDYDGPELSSIIKKDFVKIPVSANRSSTMRFIMGRIKFMRKFERRPVFLRTVCTGCQKCIKICPVEAISPSSEDNKHIILTDNKCIRCFCCAEACQDDAIDVKVKVFGV